MTPKRKINTDGIPGFEMFKFVQVSKSQDKDVEIENLKSENDRLRAALEVYANHENWIELFDEFRDGDEFIFVSSTDESQPWIDAQMALDGEP